MTARTRPVTKAMIGGEVLQWPAHKIARVITCRHGDEARNLLFIAHPKSTINADDVIIEN